MTLATRAAALLGRIPPAQTRDIKVRRDVPVTMPDGISLLTDRYWPRGGGSGPVIVMRSPYGRGTVWALAVAEASLAPKTARIPPGAKACV